MKNKFFTLKFKMQIILFPSLFFPSLLFSSFLFLFLFLSFPFSSYPNKAKGESGGSQSKTLFIIYLCYIICRAKMLERFVNEYELRDCNHVFCTCVFIFVFMFFLLCINKFIDKYLFTHFLQLRNLSSLHPWSYSVGQRSTNFSLDKQSLIFRLDANVPCSLFSLRWPN